MTDGVDNALPDVYGEGSRATFAELLDGLQRWIQAQQYSTRWKKWPLSLCPVDQSAGPCRNHETRVFRQGRTLTERDL